MRLFTQHGSILVATTYTRPNTHIPFADINNLFNYNEPTYILADFNATHTTFNHNMNNGHGIQLAQLCTLKHLRFLGPDFFTSFPGCGGRGRPDLVLTNRLSLHLHHHLSPGPVCGSDHIPIVFYVSSNPIAIPSPPRQDYTKTDWDNFAITLENINLQFNYEGQTPETLDQQAETIQNTILDAANRHSPTVHYNIYKDFRPSHRTRRLITCYRHRYTQNQLHVHRVLWDLNILRRHILDSLQEDHNLHWQNLIQHIETHRINTPSKFWSRIRKLKGTPTQHFEYLRINNNKISDPTEVTEAFKQHWETVFQPHPPTQHPLIVRHVHDIEQHMAQGHEHIQHDPYIRLANLLHNHHQHHHLISPFHPHETKSILERSPRRCPGPSGLTYHALRRLPDNFIQALTDLFNASLACGYFPRPFKTANIRLIPKPQKSPTDPSNYRPISLLDGLGKTFERLLLYRLRTHLEDNNYIPPTQFGFRPLTSTEDAVNTILTYTDCSLRTRQKTLIVTKDVEKAFDTVWHTGLKYKIAYHFDLPNPMTKLLCNFLTDRRCRIIHTDKASDYFTPRAGVPQGSVLAPTLYNMYTHDIPDVRHPDSLIIQYADDVTVLTRSLLIDTLTTRMQRELDTLTLWERKWLIHSHPDKTKATYFGTKRKIPRPLYQSTKLLDQTPIAITNSTKILGLTIDNQVRFHHHIKFKISVANKALSSLFRFRTASYKTKKHLYNAFILPLLTYCPLALKQSAPTNIISLQRIQNRAFRWIHNTKWYDFYTSDYLHTLTNRAPLNIIWHNKTLKQIEKLTLLRPQLSDKLTRLSYHRCNPRSLTLLDPESHILPEAIFT